MSVAGDDSTLTGTNTSQDVIDIGDQLGVTQIVERRRVIVLILQNRAGEERNKGGIFFGDGSHDLRKLNKYA